MSGYTLTAHTPTYLLEVLKHYLPGVGESRVFQGSERQIQNLLIRERRGEQRLVEAEHLVMLELSLLMHVQAGERYCKYRKQWSQ